MYARRLVLRPSVLVTLALAVATPTVTHALAAQPPSAPGMLQLRNTRWDGIRVDVRVGPSENCEENSPQGVHVLRREAGWAVVTDEVICWRRELVPGDSTSAWLPWQQAWLAPGDVRDVTP